MSLVIGTDPVPLSVDTRGVLRAAGTRVTLDSVVEAFQEGASANEIRDRYPSLELADIHAILAYYLRRRAEVDRYLKERREQANKIRKDSERRFDPSGIRERLLSRRRH